VSPLYGMKKKRTDHKPGPWEDKMWFGEWGEFFPISAAPKERGEKGGKPCAPRQKRRGKKKAIRGSALSGAEKGKKKQG